MKIGNPPDKPPVGPAAAVGRSVPDEASQKPAAAAPAGTEASAKVAISNTAASLMAGVGGSTAEFDAEKVARVSQAIADGSFRVNPEAIADKLIANAQELLTKASH